MEILLQRTLGFRVFPVIVAVVFVAAGCQPTVRVRGEAATTGGGLPQAPPPTALVPTSPRPSAARGRETFEKICSVCHGAEGYGDGPAAAGLTSPRRNPMTDFFKLFGITLKGEKLPSRPANFHNQIAMRLNAPFVLFETIRLGRPHTAMPAFGPKAAYGANKWPVTLKDNEIWDVLFYAWAFSTTPQTIALAREIYTSRPIDIGARTATCAACHGPDGDGKGGALSDEMAAKVWGWAREIGPGIFTDVNLLGQRKPSELFQRIADGRGPMPGYRGKLTADEIWALVDYVRTFMYDYTPARGQ
ncbi:MAG: c-type cytochrome [Armatimonadetes bacterium]|nr:c-type cytochrome [Armatimonadota bacterium]